MAVLLPSDLRQWDNATTPLTLTKEHFKEVGCAHNLSFTVKKTKFITLCSSEWSTFRVGWPPEGTSDLGTVSPRSHISSSYETPGSAPLHCHPGRSDLRLSSLGQVLFATTETAPQGSLGSL